MASWAVDALGSDGERSQKAKPRNLASVKREPPHVLTPLSVTSPWQAAYPKTARGREFP